MGCPISSLLGLTWSLHDGGPCPHTPLCSVPPYPMNPTSLCAPAICDGKRGVALAGLTDPTGSKAKGREVWLRSIHTCWFQSAWKQSEQLWQNSFNMGYQSCFFPTAKWSWLWLSQGSHTRAQEYFLVFPGRGWWHRCDLRLTYYPGTGFVTLGKLHLLFQSHFPHV